MSTTKTVDNKTIETFDTRRVISDLLDIAKSDVVKINSDLKYINELRHR